MIKKMDLENLDGVTSVHIENDGTGIIEGEVKWENVKKALVEADKEVVLN